MLAVAASAADARNSGQGGLFGLDEVKQPDIQIPAGVHWSLAERMAQEKEAFGFYFSAHPVDRFRHIADANGAKSFGLICSQPANDDGGRSQAIDRKSTRLNSSH